MNILVTGCAGFIGFNLCRELLKEGHKVIGIDSINNYYSVKLKLDRLKILKKFKKIFFFYKLDISDEKKVVRIFKKKIDVVVNLAAQAGVRYSILNPDIYLKSNIIGFYNLINASRKKNISHFVYASTSSVYGDNKNFPLKENYNCEEPLQFYASTKLSNEVIAKSFSKIYSLKTTGLRFFTVYGPWGRPDMALFKFTKNIIENKEIEIYNYGNHKRDFTYIDDIVDGVKKIIEKTKVKRKKAEIINLGNGKSVKLMKYINLIEKELSLKAKKKYLKKQAGDIIMTLASIKKAKKIYSYMPKTNVEMGVKKFVRWYKNYFKTIK
jgi:UDP-glucuronate 4-epimerase